MTSITPAAPSWPPPSICPKPSAAEFDLIGLTYLGLVNALG